MMPRDSRASERSLLLNSKISTAPVAIVGGGPVGLALALFLDRYGVRSVLFNTDDGSRQHPKGSTQNARTLEHFRSLGISESVRQLGLPADHPTDVAYFTRFNAWELCRIRMPSESDKMRAVAAAPVTDQMPEPLLRANQMYVEAFLLEHVRTRPNIALRFGWEVDQLSPDADGVTLQARAATNGMRERWRAQYLVGCDGARSFVRHMLGAVYRGFNALQQAYMGGRMIASHVRAPTLLCQCLGNRRAWQYWSINPERQMMLGSLNGKDEFIVFSQQPEPGRGPDDSVIANMIVHASGVDLPMQILGHRPWTGGVALVSERFGEGRVLLAGDAVHLFTPTGGFGMNTGIDDSAANLSWKLAAVLQGWGGSNLISSYEVERKPVAVRNTVAARELAKRIASIPISPEMEDVSADGEAARRRTGAYLATFGETFASIGVQLGVRYDDSPIIADDGPAPADDFIRYTPSSVPGGRAPHMWLDASRGRGSSLYDRLGAGFTLLRLGGKAIDTTALEDAARASGIPLKVLDVADEAARDLYDRDLAVIRPDQHIAWRGNGVPDDPRSLWAKLTGAST
jgi:2-polyprenyl-6-methoxyphenol hydroxylase-like FAD-dependent oxidoreductase